MRASVHLLTGALFGVGLVVAGMTNPAKVVGFLDLAGAWDPSLALVMVGAMLVRNHEQHVLGFLRLGHRVLSGSSKAPNLHALPQRHRALEQR